MKKIICYLLLSALLINVALNSNAFKIYGAEPCSDCTVAPSKVINESGNEVKMFEENVEVTYLENDAIIIRDYGHNYDNTFDIKKHRKNTYRMDHDCQGYMECSRGLFCSILCNWNRCM